MIKWIIYMTLLVLTSCAAKDHDHTLPPKDSSPPYTMDAAVKEENGQYYLTVETNVKLSKVNYGGSHQIGEGHIHVYRRGTLAGNITDNNQPFAITNMLFQGENEFTLSLAANDHNEGIYKLSKTVKVVKP